MASDSAHPGRRWRGHLAVTLDQTHAEIEAKAAAGQPLVPNRRDER